jgi:hypothetical protein
MLQLSKICLSFLVVVCVIACNKHTTAPIEKDCDAGVCALPHLPTGIRKTVSQDNWKFSLIGSDWDTTESPLLNTKVVSKNEIKNCLVSFVKEPTTDTYSQYIIATIRAFAAQYNHINEVSQVVINSNNFIEVQINNDTTVVWSWISVKEGYGYRFTCGSDIDVDAGNLVHNLCQKIANSIEIK